MLDVIEYLKTHKVLIENNKINKNIRKMLRNNVALSNFILAQTPFISGDIDNTYHRRLRCIIDGLTSEPVCGTCRGPVKLQDGSKYAQYCSPSCSASNPNRKEAIRHTNMGRYGGPSPHSSISVKDKTRNTNLKKYGFEYHQLSPEGKENRKQTNLKKYGTGTPFESSIIQNKSKASLNMKYGQYTYMMSTLPKDALIRLQDKAWLETQHINNNKTLYEIAGELKVSTHCVRGWFKKHNLIPQRFFSSVHQRQIKEMFEELGIAVTENTRSIIPPHEIDLFLPDFNIAIEVNGIYWHSELNGKSSNYHIEKTIKCSEQNIRLLHITDLEWENNQQVVKSRLLSMVGQTERIYARNCEVKVISSQIAREFINHTHIQGGAAIGTVCLGLYTRKNNELVSVMTFGSPRFNKKFQWELVRFSNKLNTTVVGGAGKLFSHFVKMKTPSSIISYSDRRWNRGKVYEQIGFQYSHSSAPNYQYFNTNNAHKLFHRVTFQKHKLKDKLEAFDPDLSEWENMKNNGYDRIWDCGNDVFVWCV